MFGCGVRFGAGFAPAAGCVLVSRSGAHLTLRTVNASRSRSVPNVFRFVVLGTGLVVSRVWCEGHPLVGCVVGTCGAFRESVYHAGGSDFWVTF